MNRHMHRFFSLLLAGAVVCCALFSGRLSHALLAGDVNGDGAVTAMDARLTLRAAVFLDIIDYGTAAFSAADLDGDMLITSSDARGVLRMAVGMDPNRNAAYTGGSVTEPEKTTSGTPTDGVLYQPGRYMNTTDSSLNLRADPSTASRVLGSISMLEIVSVSEVRENNAGSAETRWWGKVSKNGVTGWCALYYMTPWSLRNHTFTSAETTALWNSLLGVWSCYDPAQELQFFLQGGQHHVFCEFDDGSVSFNAVRSGDVKGDPHGLAAVSLTSAGGVAMTLFLDLTEVRNDRLVWSVSSTAFSGGWYEAEFARE